LTEGGTTNAIDRAIGHKAPAPTIDVAASTSSSNRHCIKQQQQQSALQQAPAIGDVAGSTRHQQSTMSHATREHSIGEQSGLRVYTERLKGKMGCRKYIYLG